METIKDFIVSGGVTMVPILMVSVIALGMIFERIYVLSKIKTLDPETLQALIKASENQNFEEIKNRCQNVNHPLGYILRNVFKDGWIAGDILARKVSVEGSREMRLLQRFLPSLGMMGAITPLMGLLGTVLGMIKAFMKIYQMSGDVNPSQLAGGIWEALVTTAAGLIVAIPILMAYHILSGKIDGIMFNTRLYLEDILGRHFGSRNINVMTEERAGDMDYGV